MDVVNKAQSKDRLCRAARRAGRGGWLVEVQGQKTAVVPKISASRARSVKSTCPRKWNFKNITELRCTILSSSFSLSRSGTLFIGISILRQVTIYTCDGLFHLAFRRAVPSLIKDDRSEVGGFGSDNRFSSGNYPTYDAGRGSYTSPEVLASVERLFQYLAA